jgi:signal transduction histidine kinase
MTGTMDRAVSALAEELASVCAQWSGRTGIAVETWALPGGHVPAPVARGILIAVREALANVECHSGAATVSIAVTTGGDGLRLTVSDNGRGLTATRPGAGIARMCAALTELGGRLTVHGVPGEGTTVSGVVPG